ncbi:hypothetical protein BDN72DRAFT_905086 [Pluteus cervinus]|uniref:Uncharacterized protein n=1 Tax=Pluteus cervinus TaxID=181527 RepID=A0ACD3A3M3_9AGAR|nr:hypothetical protein BDN72DRAFT_905086 [Pluteus cervinus]
MTAKALQEILGLDTDEYEEDWEQLKMYIDNVMREHMDVSPDAAPPTQQGDSLVRLIAAIAKKQPKHFARQSHKDVLRTYLILRINNLRHNGRRQGTSDGSQRMGPRAQSARRKMPRNVARNARQSSSPKRRHHASASESGSRQAQSPASDNSTIQPRQLNRSAPGRTMRGRGGLAPRHIPSHLAGRDVRQTEARTPGETDLLDFLTNRPQYRIPHLLPDLVAYGCRNMDDLKKMAEWPHYMIMDTLKQLRHRSVTTARPLDWDVLGFALWNLGGRRAD